MSHVGPFTFNAVRFTLGAATLVPLLLARRGSASTSPPAGALSARAQLLYGCVLLGAVLFAGASLQQTGIVYTTAGKAGFITGLYVVIVPLLGLLWRRRPAPGAWVGAGLAVTGLYLLSIREGLEISRGDSLVLGSAFFFAVHVLLAGWLTLRMDPVRLAFYQFCTCSALSFVAAGATEQMAMAGLRAAALPILYAGVLSVGVAYTLQIVAQREAPPGHVAIILSLEAVFAALGGALILSERLPARGLLGCALMLAGAVLSKLAAGPAPASRLSPRKRAP
jgi:drug/metabolite transporter (DMT)-like permease